MNYHFLACEMALKQSFLSQNSLNRELESSTPEKVLYKRFRSLFLCSTLDYDISLQDVVA